MSMCVCMCVCACVGSVFFYHCAFLPWDTVSYWTRSSLFQWGPSARKLPRSTCLHPPVLGLLVCTAMFGFFHGCWVFELRSSGLHSKGSYPRSHFPDPFFIFFLRSKQANKVLLWSSGWPGTYQVVQARFKPAIFLLQSRVTGMHDQV